MEQHVGHRTHTLNLQPQIARLGSLDAHWVAIDYLEPITRLFGTHKVAPLAAALAGRAQVLRGLRARPIDIAFFFTQVPAALARGGVRGLPYVVSTDITPAQYDRIGLHYGHRADKKDSLLERYKHGVNSDVFRNAAKVVGWSQWVARSLRDDYDLAYSSIAVVRPGIDVELWQPAENRSGDSTTLTVRGQRFPAQRG